MIEIPESGNLSNQITAMLQGRRIVNVKMNTSPHAFAWYYGDPNAYAKKLEGKIIENAHPVAGCVEIAIENMRLLLGDGVRLRYFLKDESLPQKHQLQIKLEDGAYFMGCVQMYGGMWVYQPEEFKEYFYVNSQQCPSPLTDAFDFSYFQGLTLFPRCKKLSLKSFLTTNQRIPGFGNGCLQDVLWKAKLHPKKRMEDVTVHEFETLFHALKGTLTEMTAQGGRDTELDLVGNRCGYKTILSRNTRYKVCPRCGTSIVKEPYLGGSIYYCPTCQPI